jgi:hypothetical protein
MREVSIKVVPHGEQRYETVGDWTIDGEKLTITVSDLGDWRYNMAVAVHELVEAILCEDAGVNQADVDRFDIDFERKRSEGDMSEPGDDALAPYQNEHCFATAVERMLIAALNVAWSQYDKTVLSIGAKE